MFCKPFFWFVASTCQVDATYERPTSSSPGAPVCYICYILLLHWHFSKMSCVVIYFHMYKLSLCLIFQPRLLLGYPIFHATIEYQGTMVVDLNDVQGDIMFVLLLFGYLSNSPSRQSWNSETRRRLHLFHNCWGRRGLVQGNHRKRTVLEIHHLNCVIIASHSLFGCYELTCLPL